MSALIMTTRRPLTDRSPGGSWRAFLAMPLLAALAIPLSPAQAQQPPGTVEASPFGAARNARATAHDATYPRHRLRDGAVLDSARIHYWTMGKPRRDERGRIDNAVLVLHWTGASGAAMLGPAWDEALFGPGTPLDSSRYFLIFPDNLGHGGSSKPSDGLRARFPHYGYGDLVDLQHRLVTETLGIDHLRLVLGMSMGGMNAWQWAERYPTMMDGAVSLAALPTKLSGRNLLWRQIIVDQIREDPEWKGGDYTSPPGGWLRAFPFLRMMIGNRDGLTAALPDRAAGAAFRDQSRAQAVQSDANDVAYALEASIIDYDPEADISKIRTPFLSINFADDELYPDAKRIIERVRPANGAIRYDIVDNGAQGAGHLSVTRPGLWKDKVAAFMTQTEGSHPLPAETDKTASSAIDPVEVRQAAEAFTSALENLDLAGVMARMSPSTLLFFPPEYEKTIPVGIAEIESAWTRVFARIRERSGRSTAPFIRIIPRDLRISASGDTALATFTFPVPDGNNGRRTLVFGRENGRLVIIHLHGSSDR